MSHSPPSYDEMFSSPPSYRETIPTEQSSHTEIVETSLLEDNNVSPPETQQNENIQLNIPQGYCQTCKQRIITSVMLFKLLCLLCIIAWILLFLFRFADTRGRQCESIILKILNSTKCITRLDNSKLINNLTNERTTSSLY
ncbi:hypothetical protein ACQ4LE_005177 [Meloidogyne hapla]